MIKFISILGCILAFSIHAASFQIELKPDLGLISQFKASELCEVAEKTNNYIGSNAADSFAVHAGQPLNKEFTLERVTKTQEFICTTYREDVRANRNSRLHDNSFMQANFDFYRWLPDKKTATKIAKKSTNNIKTRLLNNIPEDQIFLTKYYTKLLEGSEHETVKFSQALYALPNDEQGMSLQQAENNKEHLTRFKYTRQQVIKGSLRDEKLAKPLIWITEEALHDVLLQGTGVLKVHGVIRYFNVHRNNNINYDYAIGKREQARYWYFAEVPSIMGYGLNIEGKIEIKPQVTFAGNVAELGLGKLIMVSFQQTDKQVSRIGVLADQGGAFDHNLFQLDMLVDSYQGWADYHQENKHLPDYANAWIMLVK